MYTRQLKESIEENLFKSKVILLVGPRQVGKTTLLREIVKTYPHQSTWLNCDEGDIKRKLETATTSTGLMALFGNSKLVVIDEAQQVENIGLKLKLIIDTNPEIQVIATGSSAFELLQKSNEPLTGRKKEYTLYPISFAELVNTTSLLKEKRLLERRIIFGCYPEVLNNKGSEISTLKEIVNSYLYKDILRYDGIKKSAVLDKLLLALALQTGCEVNYNELAKTIGNINPATVEKYIDLLEKTFVVYKLPALSRNLRNEIKKGKKIYFYDTGIRNAIINNFNDLQSRTDKGALWENFLISERIKSNNYKEHYCRSYFWRTFDQAEVDYIEEYQGALHLYEIKWKQNRKKMPISLVNNYPIGGQFYLDIENFEEFIL